MNANVIEQINATNQKYLKNLVGKEIPQRLKDQLNNMDWSCLNMLEQKEQKRGTFAPLGAMEVPEIKEREAEFKAIGIEAMKQCKVAAVLLAGGQGTRLGFDKAKGMYNIGVTKDLYIFEQLIRNLQNVVAEVGADIPLYIMTSDKNDKDTREFFAEHDYFGYNKEFVKFFVQEMVPAVDFDGNVVDSKVRPSAILMQLYKDCPIRQHVSLNSKGVTKGTGKFDNQVAYKGSRFCFDVELMVGQTDAKECFLKILGAIRRGFRVGGSTRKGYGCLEVKSLWTKEYNTDNDYLEHSTVLSVSE